MIPVTAGPAHDPDPLESDPLGPVDPKAWARRGGPVRQRFYPVIATMGCCSFA
ncbi:MAG TPA: hypothetical protein VN828_08580 [Acidobacteriaceae bacterium]|nr:hypothetical protein [Acidobacteriaceae bacterium]